MPHKINNGQILDYVKGIVDSKISQVNISWRSLNVTVPGNILTKCKNNGKIEKRILKNADGLVKSGEMLALMGASGSGKTTLLNVLNFRSAGNLIIEGKIMINGSTATSEKISMVSSFVQQDYLFFGTLTGKIYDQVTFL
jgi:ABC-type multidrug transport system ATPase subunit